MKSRIQRIVRIGAALSGAGALGSGCAGLRRRVTAAEKRGVFLVQGG
jgi:hypothetical protein